MDKLYTIVFLMDPSIWNADTRAPMEENGMQFVHSTLGILNS